MKTITLPCFGIVVEVQDGSGNITSDLQEDTEKPSTDAWIDEQQYNCMMDGIESLILAHACAGIDITTPKYIEGIETAVEACANNPSHYLG